MQDYAIIQIVGKQYRVSEGETLTLDRLELEPGQTQVVSDVLLVKKGDTVSVGQPLVAGATVTLKSLADMKGEKIRVATFKAKSRFRKVHGHRQYQTQVLVEKIAVK